MVKDEKRAKANIREEAIKYAINNFAMYHPRIAKAIDTDMWKVSRIARVAKRELEKRPRKERISFVITNPLGHWGSNNQVVLKVYRDGCVTIRRGYRIEYSPDFFISKGFKRGKNIYDEYL